ncbi:MAG TPA: TetR/AcrR family transcriptional regulator [Armatimonadota bacterium]|jgi:AcrR family transcriptional regulator
MNTQEPDTRERLLIAAAHIYTQRGSRGMTTRAVAQRAGVSELTLFRQFGTKQGLLDALGERFASVENVDHLFAGADTGDLYTDLCAVARNAMAAMREVQLLMRVQLMEVSSHPEQEPFLAKRPLAAIRLLGAFFAHRQDTGEVGPGDPILFAHMFLALLFARTIGAPMFRHVIPHSEDVVIETFVEVFVHGVASRPENE